MAKKTVTGVLTELLGMERASTPNTPWAHRGQVRTEPDQKWRSDAVNKYYVNMTLKWTGEIEASDELPEASKGDSL